MTLMLFYVFRTGKGYTWELKQYLLPAAPSLEIHPIHMDLKGFKEPHICY